MDLSRTSKIKRRFVASLSSAATEKLKNAPLSTSSVYLRPSPTSNPLLSLSSSLCASTSTYPNPVIGQTHGTKVARVSSTTSVASQSLSTLTNNTMSTDSLTHTSVEQRVVCERADMDGEMYDPFYPTDGVKGDEEKCEKYDPFDPTGSPTSDIDGRSGKVGGIQRNSELDDDDLEEPPDSTDALTGLSSPCQITAVSWRQRVDSNSNKAQKTDSDDSDHSEIEEGEIIGLTDRNGSAKRSGEDISPLSSTRVSFLGSKPERILRVLDGDGFVSVRTEANWKTERQTEDEPTVEVEDLRSKLVSRRKERYLSYPPSSSLSPQAPLSPSNLLTVTPPTHFTSHVEQSSKKYKFSKSVLDTDRSKSKNKNPGEKEERKKKKRKKEEGVRERCKDKDREQKEDKRSRNSRSSSRKARKRHHSSLDVSRTWKSEKKDRAGSFLSHSEEGKRDGAWNIDRDIDTDRHRGRDKYRGKERERERERSHTSSRRRDEREKDSGSQKKTKEIKGRHHSSSREHGKSKRSKRSREKREIDKDGQRDREWRRDGRPVVPPSIQDLNGSDLFAIKRTITVTTTTTTTTVPGSPRLAPASPCQPTENSAKPHKKKKRKWHSVGEVEDCCSQSQSLSPPRYHSYESDHYSDKLEIDVLSLDGEALDSDYPSLEDTPPAPLPPEPPVPSPKTKTNPKTVQHHVKKKPQPLKKNGQSESSSPPRSKSKCTSSLMVTTGSATVSSGLGLAKRSRKIGKEKDRDKGSRKGLVRSGKLKKEGGRKSKLQSKVSVLVREGVSSTTGPSVGSGKMGIDLLGPGGTSGGSGSSVVGGSIAVVFCRDNESRSPFLKPCSEPLSLGNRSKDLANMEKRNRLATPSLLSSPARLKPKKTKQSSITSTSSLASSPSSSSVNKGRRRTGKKNKEKSEATGSVAADANQTKTSTETWSGASLEVQSVAGDGRKSVSPHTSQAGPAPCSSSASSSSVSALPPLSSPPRTPPPSNAPLQDTRESSPDSQTVDSSCKTPDPLFLAEECPSQTSPNLPASGPPSISISHGSGLNITLSTPTPKSLPPDNASKSLISPPCLSSSAGCGLSSLSLPLSSSDPSSSSVSSSSASKPPPPLPPPSPALPWSLQTGVDCTTGGVLALTALLFKMEEANIASRAKAQEFIQATSQILSQANQNQSQHQVPVSSASTSQIPPPPTLPPPPGLSPAQFILHSSLPLVGCTKTPPSLLHTSIGGGCAQTPPPIMPVVLSGISGSSGETGWDNETKDPDKYLKKLHTQERAVEEVKLAIKPYYQRKDINKDEYKDILRKAVHKICHSRTGEINPVKVSNLVKLYVQRYKYFRKHGRKMGEEEKEDRELGALHSSA